MGRSIPVGSQNALVLQPGFMVLRPSAPVGSAGALLMASTPRRPMEHGSRSGWSVPDEAPEQAPHLGHGQRQQLGGEVVLVRPPPGRARAARRERGAPGGRAGRAGA